VLKEKVLKERDKKETRLEAISDLYALIHLDPYSVSFIPDIFNTRSGQYQFFEDKAQNDLGFNGRHRNFSRKSSNINI
jgi:hypothetical protein